MRRPSTHERYSDILERHVFPTLGKKPIDEIKRYEIRNLILKKNKAGLSRSMLCLIRGAISGTMGHAVEDEIIPGNLVSGIMKRLNLERDKRITVDPMTDQEVQFFLKPVTNISENTLNFSFVHSGQECAWANCLA